MFPAQEYKFTTRDGKERTIYYEDTRRQENVGGKLATIMDILRCISLGKVIVPGSLSTGEIPTFAVRISMAPLQRPKKPFFYFKASTAPVFCSSHDNYAQHMMRTLSDYPGISFTGPMPTKIFLAHLFDVLQAGIKKEDFPIFDKIEETAGDYPMTCQLPDSVWKGLADLYIYRDYGGVSLVFDDTTFLGDGTNISEPLRICVAFHGEDEAGQLKKPEYGPLQQFFALYIMKRLVDAFPVLYPQTTGEITNLDDYKMNCLTLLFWDYLTNMMPAHKLGM